MHAHPLTITTNVGRSRCSFTTIISQVSEYIDPWLAAQGKPSLLTMWGGNSNISRVSTRMLLGMRSGLADYNDRYLFNWTLYHPTQARRPFWGRSHFHKTVVEFRSRFPEFLFTFSQHCG